MVGGLFVKRAGQGPRVVLLHGSMLAGELCWSQQLRLADRWRSRPYPIAPDGHRAELLESAEPPLHSIETFESRESRERGIWRQRPWPGLGHLTGAGSVD